MKRFKTYKNLHDIFCFFRNRETLTLVVVVIHFSNFYAEIAVLGNHDSYETYFQEPKDLENLFVNTKLSLRSLCAVVEILPVKILFIEIKY